MNYKKLLLLLCATAAIFAIGVFIFQVNPAQMGLYLLVLLCPLSHIFLMNHGSYERKKDHADSENSNISNLSVVQTGNKLIDK